MKSSYDGTEAAPSDKDAEPPRPGARLEDSPGWAELRRRAEAHIPKPEIPPPKSEADLRRLLHELQVHQIELELQNEELREAQAALEVGLEKYTDLYDFSPVGYLSLGPGGEITEANLTGASLLRINRATLMKQRFGFFVSPEDRPHFTAFLQRAFKGLSQEGCDVRLLLKGHEPVDVRIKAIVLPSGRSCRMALTDNTARKKSEEELRAEKELLASTLSSIEDGVITLDARRTVRLINPAAGAMIGKTVADATGRPFNALFQLVDLDRSSDKDQLTDLLEDNLAPLDSGARKRLFIFRINGLQDRVVAISAHRILGVSSADHCVLLVFRDVSKDFETDRLKQDFIDSISHDLRTPLTTIRGFIDTLLADADMSEKTRLEFLAIVRFQSKRLSELVDNLLEMPRIDAGCTLYEDEPLQLGTIAESSLAEVRPQADAKRVQLGVSIQPDLPDFTGDAMRLQSTFSNLLANAVKFTPEDGRVRLELSLDQGKFHLSIRDTGPGIAEEHLDRIFEKFYRIPIPGRPTQGTGLGLSIAAAIVDHYLGQIKVESQVGQGSCFHVFLPLYLPSLQNGPDRVRRTPWEAWRC